MRWRAAGVNRLFLHASQCDGIFDWRAAGVNRLFLHASQCGGIFDWRAAGVNRLFLHDSQCDGVSNSPLTQAARHAGRSPRFPMIVVKVGGSLYDHPALGPGLRAFLDALASSPVLVVPGGGPFADAVRDLDAVHGLGEVAAHRLALRAMDLAGEFLKGLALRSEDCASRLNVMDALAFDDDAALPHSWAVTSDSIALRAAIANRAERLILLKSVSVPPGTPWSAAAAQGWVDEYFPQLAAAAPFPIEALNFRLWLERFSRPA